jgi:hypothetical protein
MRAIVFTDKPVACQGKADFRRACVLGILEKFVNEMRAVWVEVLEDIEVDFPSLGVEAVDELTATLNQSLKVFAVN